MVISHNLLAMNAQRQFNITGNQKKKSTEKLSSGYRINRSADDAAGLAISEKMRRQIRGLDQGARNIQDGISLLQVADGALNEDHEILQRMNQLAIQAANGTNTAEDRSAIQQEMNQLVLELDRTANTTSFNEKIYPLNHGGGTAILPASSSSSSAVTPTGEINPDFASLRQVKIDLDHLSTGNYDGYSVTGSGDSKTVTITGTDNYVFNGNRDYPPKDISVIINSDANITMGDIELDGEMVDRKPGNIDIVINEGKKATLWDIPAKVGWDVYSINELELKEGSVLTFKGTNPGNFGENTSHIFNICMNKGTALNIEWSGISYCNRIKRAEDANNLTINLDHGAIFIDSSMDDVPLIDVDTINLLAEADIVSDNRGNSELVADTTEHSYPALNFTSNAKIYLYGCHTASDSRSKVLAFIQGATVYANRYSASFSMEKDFRKYVSDDAYGKDVYLYSYAMDLVNKPTADTGGLIFAYKIPEIALTLVNAPLDIRLSAPKRVPMVVYYPEE